MNIYNRNFRCPKCDSFTMDKWVEETNTMLRRCRCGYEWEEYALDSSDKEDIVYEGTRIVLNVWRTGNEYLVIGEIPVLNCKEGEQLFVKILRCHNAD